MKTLKGLLIFSLLCISEILTAQTFSISAIPDAVFQRMEGCSWPKNASIKRSDYRYLTISYFDENGTQKQGQMICGKSVAEDLLQIFRELYAIHYPIHSIRLVDEYGASDEKSMAANNTSSFNYRCIYGTKKLSKHSLGTAIDINPLWNPCVHSNGLVEPANGTKYKNRKLKGKGLALISTEDECYKIFIRHGWKWGGAWRSKKDYQHFEK